MANYNKVLLMGRLTRDPELRYTPGGTAVVDFGMAINRTWSGQDGKKGEETCFVDLQAWARRAEVISEYCRKGSPIFVEGRLQLDTWEGRDGQKRSKLRVVVDNFQFLGSPSGRRTGEKETATRQDGRAPAPAGEAASPEPATETEPSPEEDSSPKNQYKVDEDIPF